MLVVHRGRRAGRRALGAWEAPQPTLRQRASARLQQLFLPSLRQLHRDRTAALAWTLHRAARALSDAGVDFAVAGGTGRWIRGGPEVTHDVDFLVAPASLERARDALRAVRMRPGQVSSWGLQIWDGRVEVDLICSPAGIEVTDDILRRADVLDVEGMPMPVVALEDDLVFKLLAITERTPDYKDLLVAARCLREQVDWDDVRRRSAGSPFAAAFFTIADSLGLTERSAVREESTRQLPVSPWVDERRRRRTMDTRVASSGSA